MACARDGLAGPSGSSNRIEQQLRQVRAWAVDIVAGGHASPDVNAMEFSAAWRLVRAGDS